jgi:hypothetical protein
MIQGKPQKAHNNLELACRAVALIRANKFRARLRFASSRQPSPMIQGKPQKAHNNLELACRAVALIRAKAGAARGI